MSFAGSFEQTAMLVPYILGRSSGALISTLPVFLTSDKWEDITLRGGRQHKSQNENGILKRMKENMTHDGTSSIKLKITRGEPVYLCFF